MGDKLCVTGCGKFLKNPHAQFCTSCGTIYRSMIKSKKYKSLDNKDLYNLIVKKSQERKQKIQNNLMKL